MRKCRDRFQRAIIATAASATLGYCFDASATTFYLYDATQTSAAPDPASAAGGSWQNVIGGTQTLITAGAGNHPQDGNYWQVDDQVTNGSKGYGIATPAPPASVFTDPNGWTATEVVKVPLSTSTKTSAGLYTPPSFLDVRTPSIGIADIAQLNAGADEGYFRSRSGGSTDISLQDMDVHSYFNTYQMVFTPPVLDDEGALVAPAKVGFYCNGFLLREEAPSALNTTTVSRIQWFSGAQAASQTIQYQKVSFESGNAVVTAPAPVSWSSGNGSFSASANWTGGVVPTGANSTAKFGNQGGPTAVTIDQPASVGLVELNSTGAYTIGGAGTLTLGFSRRGAGAIDVVQGNHVVSAPLAFERSAMFSVLDAAASLSITGPVDTAGKDFRKAGPGALDVANVRANSLKISGGTLTVRANGTAAGVSKVSSLDISVNYTATGGTNTPNIPIATMELNDNPLIIDYTGTPPMTTLRQNLKGAFNTGSWDAQGLTSSVVKANAADTNNPVKLALAYGDASAIGVSTVGDQTLDSTSLLVRITLGGDANMDGKVNALDFNAVAANFGAAAKVWTQGDFNYDGTVNTNDFTALAANFNQSMNLAPGVTLGTVVPEPGVAMLALAALGVLRRSRQR